MSEPEQKTGNKLVLVGDSGVGKTCLISRFISGSFDKEEQTTNGASYASKLIEYPNLNKNLVLDIWDTAGQEKFRSLTKFFYKDALMVIMVYDITRRESFDNLKNYWYEEMKDNTEPNIVLAIAGNKCDLYEKEAVPEKEARDFATSINALFALTSAQDNTGVEKLFRDIGNKFLDPDFQEKANERQRAPSVALKKKEHIDKPENPVEKKKKRKC
jgi:Ras-related protein Rab-11A